ncbi:MAG: 3'(2'),5'-bisphosphate nucleotidase [Rhodobiaceae bacterium]|nr:3'(2'),5'-bisphosphate nucleotidase [Rhodobiaceae bacterium]
MLPNVMKNNNQSSHKKLAIELINISQKSALEIMKIYETNFEINYKKDKSPVTLADRISEEIILHEISKIEPGVDVISEEKYFDEESKINSDCFFLIDPIDGTREFIKKNGEFTINIALVEKNKPVLGIINAPARNDIYFAYNNLKSYKISNKDDAIEIRTRQHTKTKVMLHSRSIPSREMQGVMDQYGINQIRRCGSALKFGLLAEGLADLYIRLEPCYEWDTAAGQVILEGAGGAFFDINFNEFEYNKPNFLNSDGFVSLANLSQKEYLLK